jgi:(p)ppGpp synthase/HD superfamily hydrolase
MLTTVSPPFLNGRPVLRQAYEWAAKMHGDQLRDVDRAPFILHPLEVAALLASRGFDDEVIAAGLLHDVVEGTDTDVEEVRQRFGDRIADMVAAVSDDPSIAGYVERKAAQRAQVAAAGPDAQAVYLADKVAKARELRAKAARAESSLDDHDLQRRLEHYERSFDALSDTGHRSLVEALAFELWALRTLPPSPG